MVCPFQRRHKREKATLTLTHTRIPLKMHHICTSSKNVHVTPIACPMSQRNSDLNFMYFGGYYTIHQM